MRHVTWSRTSRRRRSSSLTARNFAVRIIHKIFQLFTRLEEGNLLRRHIHFRAGLRIATDTPAPLPGAKTSKAANLNFVALLQRLDDALENRLHDGFRLFSRKFRNP